MPKISTAMPATQRLVLTGWPVHTSVENSREIIRDVFSAEETYAVCLKEDRRAIGSIGLIPPEQTQVAVPPTEMEIGFWIGVPFWGRGYIPEAVREIQRHAFEDQEKCGFTFHHTEEGVDCPLIGEVRTEHFTYLSREKWSLI